MSRTWTSPLTVDMTDQTWTSPLTVDMTDQATTLQDDRLVASSKLQEN